MSWLSITGLQKQYPGPVHALHGIELAVGKGEFFAILGPTNAGKSTLLKTIAGVETAGQGRIELAGRDIAALEPRDRRLSLLFQSIALFPNRTGFENVAFPLRVAKRTEAAIHEQVAEAASLLPARSSAGPASPHFLGRRAAAGCDRPRVGGASGPSDAG